MPDFRRYFVPGGTYFFTLVTAYRASVFRSARARAILGGMMRQQREEAPFETVAIVLLPDHMHTMWTLPPGDDDYPNRWKAIKAKFTSAWLEAGGKEQFISLLRSQSQLGGAAQHIVAMARATRQALLPTEDCLAADTNGTSQFGVADTRPAHVF